MRKPRNIETSEDEFGYWEQTDDGPVWHRTNEDGTPYEEESDPDFIPLEQMEAEDGDDGDDGDNDAHGDPANAARVVATSCFA